jgi:hypothetical protein
MCSVLWVWPAECALGSCTIMSITHQLQPHLKTKTRSQTVFIKSHETIYTRSGPYIYCPNPPPPLDPGSATPSTNPSPTGPTINHFIPIHSHNKHTTKKKCAPGSASSTNAAASGSTWRHGTASAGPAPRAWARWCCSSYTALCAARAAI